MTHPVLKLICSVHLVSNKGLLKHLSRLTLVSCAVQLSRTSATSVCYIHEQSILIECLPKAYCKNNLMKKQHALLKPLTIIRHIRLVLNKLSSLFLSYTLWNVGQAVIFFSISISSFAYSLRIWA